MAAISPKNPDAPGDAPVEASGLLESGGYLALTPREGAPDFNTSFTLEYDRELEEYTISCPSPNTPQNVEGSDARRLLCECARFYTIEYVPD